MTAEIVEISLSEYPLPDIKKELISGLNFGFKLQYSGTRLSYAQKTLKAFQDILNWF